MSEQERADLLAHEIDRLLAGERVDGTDPLLDVARNLAGLPLRPGAVAAARFEGQLQQWFGSPVARGPRTLRTQVVLIAVVVIAVLIGIAVGLLFLPNRQNIQATATPTITATATVTPTASATVTPTAIATANATPNFSRIIISGTVDSIQGATILVVGQSILLDRIPSGLCVGDVVNIEADEDQNNVIHAYHNAVTVVSSACSNPPPAPQQNPPRGGSGGSGSGNGGDDHHRDG